VLQARWTAGGIEVAEIEPGPVRPGFVRLRVGACGICGTDLHLLRRELPVLPGGVPGHEIVGTPLPGEGAPAEGLYAVEPLSRCGQCDLCISGKPQLCPSGGIFGIAHPGGLAEFVDVPAYTLHPIDPALPARVASISEPLAVCVRGVNLARLTPSSRVLVLGAGTIGLLCGVLARDRAAEVVVVARHPHQHEAARALGLDAVSEDQAPDWAQERAPDVVIETVGGSAGTLEAATRLCRAAGRVVVLGVFSGPLPIDALGLVLKELTVVGSNTYGSDRRGSEFRSAVDLLRRYRREIEIVQTHRFPLRDIEAAFAAAADKQSGPIKVTVEP
jgi:threonine dehydrogenase-like Zn-dependent dehydrogenase